MTEEKGNDTNRRFYHKNSLRIFMIKGFALRRKILPPLKFCDTNQRFGRKIFKGGFCDTNQRFGRKIFKGGFCDTNQRFGRKNWKFL
jgi:hypothetical protein